MARTYNCPDCNMPVKLKDRYGHRDMHMQQQLDRFYAVNAEAIIKSPLIPTAVKKQVARAKEFEVPKEIPDFVKEVL